MESVVQYAVRNLHLGLKMADRARDVDFGTNIVMRIDKIDQNICKIALEGQIEEGNELLRILRGTS